MTITLDVPPELETPLQQAARLQGKDVRAFLLDSLRLRLRPDISSEAETRLLLAINTPLPEEVRAERDALLDLQADRPFTTEELSRFAELSDQIEMDNAERWRCIGELSRIRGLSLPEMAAQLGIPLR